MRLKSNVLPFLQGTEFSNGLRVDFELGPDDHVFLSRFTWLERLCAGKAVIHAGCVDHSADQIRHKLRRHKWLHARLVEHTERCYGVDKDEAGIDFLRTELGYDDVECLDLITGESETIKSSQWDYLVLAEVLEHIDNPVQFLQSIKAKYQECVRGLIITVPNAFAQENFKHARRGIEAINTDHRYWFTPYTLAKVVTGAGLSARDLILCRNGIVKKRSFIKNAYLRSHPLLRNNIIMIAGFSDAPA